MYVNNFHNSLNHAHAIMYADDTNLFTSNKCPEKSYSLAQQELQNVANWLLANKLSLNTNKTKYILFDSNHKKINNNKHQSLYFKRKPIEQVKNILFLGLHLNENISWKPHLLTLFKKLRNISIVYKQTFYLNKTNLLNVYYSLIVSHLRYGITVWNYGNQTIVQKLHRICNAFIIYIQKNKHIEALNLPSITDIFTLETGIFMYKLNRNQLPEIFNPLFKFNNIVHSISTRNKNAYRYPFYSKSLTQQSVEYSGVKVWNTLPNDIKSLQSKLLFSSKLKHHLSKPTYPVPLYLL